MELGKNHEIGFPYDGSAVGRKSASLRQWGWSRTRLTCLRSTHLVWSRMASSKQAGLAAEMDHKSLPFSQFQAKGSQVGNSQQSHDPPRKGTAAGSAAATSETFLSSVSRTKPVQGPAPAIFLLFFLCLPLFSPPHVGAVRNFGHFPSCFPVENSVHSVNSVKNSPSFLL